jgi:hypothetical protein
MNPSSQPVYAALINAVAERYRLNRMRFPST